MATKIFQHDIVITGVLHPLKVKGKKRTRLVLITIDNREYYIRSNTMGKKLSLHLYERMKVQGRVELDEEGRKWMKVTHFHAADTQPDLPMTEVTFQVEDDPLKDMVSDFDFNKEIATDDLRAWAVNHCEEIRWV